MRQVIGKYVNQSKSTGKTYTTLCMICDFDSYFIQNRHAQGNNVDTCSVEGHLDVSVGDKIDLIYGKGFGGKAVITGIQKVK